VTLASVERKLTGGLEYITTVIDMHPVSQRDSGTGRSINRSR
jgi:hypothetical protein